MVKIIDERETQEKKQRQKRTKGTKAFVNGWENNEKDTSDVHYFKWFCCAFKLGFL